ncbi:hypothetical protein J4E80_001028 [Alternaria sp. BMP 0032]|nr:hypothetical protein J4E80_001028 [Alternaria sp. BMP 0032]
MDQKRSHAQMDGEQASASPAWRHGSFPDNREAPPTYHGLPFGYDYDDRQSPANDIYDPPARYHFDRPPTPSFESALRSHARPPIERASSSAQHSHTAGLHLPRLGNMASSASRRFAGDGFDYRRPAGSASQHTTASVDLTGDDEDDVAIDLSQDDDIIDLTADDSGDGASHNGNNAREQQQDRGQQESHRGRHHPRRLPRGFDIIIDLDNGEEEWHPDPPAPQPSSPEIEFISSRTIPGQRHLQPVDENESDGEDVRFIRANALPEAEARRRQRNEQLDNVMDLFGTLNGRFTHLRAQVDRFHEQVNRTANRFHEPVAPSRSASRGRAPHIRVGAFQAPNLDFDIIGFDIGPRVREAPPPPATYDAPPPAPEGFTRSPEEEGEALICPNCEEQLCVGSDEIKRQVWIVKGCGHVYCGECTANRSAKRSAKGKETRANTNPFKVCVVEDCDKNVSHKKSMIQVFL